MKHTSTMAVLTLGMTLWMFGLPSDGSAKPKSRVFGCSYDDLQTNFAGSCLRQAEQDIIKGNSYIHVVICEGGQQKCCTVSDSGQILNCRRPAGSPIMPGTRNQLNQTPILGRGVDGADQPGEETPVPSWLTKEWIQERDGKDSSK